jgi:hypothetical protein
MCHDIRIFSVTVAGASFVWATRGADILEAVVSGNWGYTNNQGALLHWGHEVGRTTMASILEMAGKNPVPCERMNCLEWH